MVDVQAYLPMVRSMAGSFARKTNLDREELTGVAMLGLANARRRFDPERGVKFWTFASHYVKGAILDFINRQAGFGRPHETSLDAPIYEDDGASFHVLVADPRSDAFAGRLEDDDFQKHLNGRIGRIIDRMPRQMQVVMKSHFFDGETMKAAGLRAGVSESWTSRLINQGVAQIKKALIAEERRQKLAIKDSDLGKHLVVPLREWRKNNDVTQKEAAQMAGVSTQVIWAMENGRGGYGMEAVKRVEALIAKDAPHAEKVNTSTERVEDLAKNEHVTPAARQTQAVKHDTEKTRMELLPPGPLQQIADVLTFGAKKYDAWNYRKGMHWSRLFGAALRHLFAWYSGEDNDPETKMSHLAHAACCILFIMDIEKLHPHMDDRPR